MRDRRYSTAREHIRVKFFDYDLLTLDDMRQLRQDVNGEQVFNARCITARYGTSSARAHVLYRTINQH
jgi:hypothetical protein